MNSDSPNTYGGALNDPAEPGGPCVAYGDHLAFERKQDAELAAARHGWEINVWSIDQRSHLARPLAQRPGLLRALERSIALGLPLLIVNREDLRSDAEILMVSAAAEFLGVHVRTARGRVLSRAAHSDVLEFALHQLIREITETRDAVLSLLTLNHQDLHQDTDGCGATPPSSGDGDSASNPTSVDATVLPLRRRLEAYQCLAHLHEQTYGCPLTPLPDPAVSWPVRRRQIGRLARRLSELGWPDRETAALLTEAGVFSRRGASWYGELVAYYRATYGTQSA